MKKTLTLLLTAVMLACAVFGTYGCTGTDAPTSTTQATAAPTEAPTENPDDIKEQNISYAKYTQYKLETDVPVKNIIIMVGDGMGLNHVKAAEIQKGDKLAMACMPYTAQVTTDSLTGTTDSAAAATALACGVKTYNKYIGMDKDDNPVENIMEVAEGFGMKRGIAVTQHVAHATPAGFTAHVSNRDAYMKILSEQLKAEIDVMLGGGQQFYKKGVKNLLAEHDYQYVDSASKLDTLTPDKKALGLFRYENILAGYKPALADMADTAIRLLENDNGFVLLVEGSDIDTRSHKSDMEAMLREMIIFDNAVDTVLRYASENPGTLVIVTADHETGGLTIPDGATAEDLTSELFTSDGEHTGENVGVWAAGAQADTLFENGGVIDNTDIGKMMKRVLTEAHEDAADQAP